MNKLISYKINILATKISNQSSLPEILSLLEKHNINPVGNLTNTSKRTILVKSLRTAQEKDIEDLIRQFFPKYSSADNKQEISINLHATFKGTKVEKFLKTGDMEEAVRIAFLRINNRAKRISNSALDGAPLMRRIFSRNNPILKLNDLKTQEEKDEQEGIMHIFEGSMLAFRNPTSHNDEKRIEPDEALTLLRLAGYLMLILDRFEKANANLWKFGS